MISRNEWLEQQESEKCKLSKRFDHIEYRDPTRCVPKVSELSLKLILK